MVVHRVFGAGRHHAATEAQTTQINVHTLQTPVARPGHLGATSVACYRHLQLRTVACDKCLNLYKTHTH